MANRKQQQYPDYLNPFGDDDENEEDTGESGKDTDRDYPDYLSPFGDEDDVCHSAKQNDVNLDYDDSLNPFGDDVSEIKEETRTKPESDLAKADELANPFESEEDANSAEIKGQRQVHIDRDHQPDERKANQSGQQSDTEVRIASSFNDRTPAQHTEEPESLEPPKPLPRTKSLLKKEQANKRRQQDQQSVPEANQAPPSIASTTSSTTSSSSLTTTTPLPTVTSFQRKKNKRSAPPVPINFKRQVSGSLDAIEAELNELGDKLSIIEKESNLCQDTLKAQDETEETDLAITRNKFIELIKRKNSILRRQKELMYKKREMKLDQIHADIEYELRMIGNKQLSNRTTEDESKEKDLLKKLVEIVEEKNDIVENLNKDIACDNTDIEEAFRRLNISIPLPDKSPEKKPVKESAGVTVKGENCDKSSLTKLSKIATLLPKSGTIKRTVKLRRKGLLKKYCNPQPIER